MREPEAGLGIPKTTVSEILAQDLGMKFVVAKFVPQLLLLDQKEHRAAVANDLIQTAANKPDVLKKVITRDVSQGATLKGTKTSLSYVQCLSYLLQ